MSISLSSPAVSPARPLSRPSSRGSIRSLRAHSPSLSLDDPVAVRHHMSALKHSIRYQQAQLHNLENVVLRGPRPLAPGIMASPPLTPDELPDVMSPTPPHKMQRRSSFDVLHGLAPDSSLPLPRREGASTPSRVQDGGIREGIPMEFSNGKLSPNSYKRASSPTRTLSRIPVASVADEGHSPIPRSPGLSPIDPGSATLSPSLSSLQPSSPNRRISLTPGGTTKVLADLQTGVINARNALENTKAQLRLSQRSVAQLTRQTEDLKEGRERLRLENEGLNNVVARKERLLQEVLDRARKAEAEAATLKSQLKTETSTSKKSLREMEAALTESTALSQKSEREYITLRDSIKRMVEGWKADTDKLRDEMKKQEDRWRQEAEEVGRKYKLLVEEVEAKESRRDVVKELMREDERIRKEVEDEFRAELDKMRAEVEQSSKQNDQAAQTARHLSAELVWLRRLMQSASPAPQDQSTFPGTSAGTDTQ